MNLQKNLMPILTALNIFQFLISSICRNNEKEKRDGKKKGRQMKNLVLLKIPNRDRKKIRILREYLV